MRDLTISDWIILLSIFFVFYNGVVYLGRKFLLEKSLQRNAWRRFRKQRKEQFPTSQRLLKGKGLLKDSPVAYNEYKCKLFLYQEGLVIKIHNPFPLPVNPTVRLFFTWEELRIGPTVRFSWHTLLTYCSCFFGTRFIEIYTDDSPLRIYLPERFFAEFQQLWEEKHPD